MTHAGPLDWFNVGDPTTRDGADLLVQRYQSLQRQVPLLYLSCLASFVGLHLATAGSLVHINSPIMLVVFLLMCRLALWVRRRACTPSPQEAARQLRITLFFAALFSISFSIWALRLSFASVGDRPFAILFGSLASVGCAYGLSSFPKAAQMPLFLLGLPLGLMAIASGEANYTGAGVTLILIILLVSRVLSVHNEDLMQLSLSRSQTIAERERALEAERAANLERMKATAVAGTDHLSGLPNRRAFVEALDIRIEQTRSLRPQDPGAVAIMDLDGFKPINDAFGHGIGDAVLKLVGERFSLALREGDICARIGGDEFAILLPSCSYNADAERVGTLLCASLEQPLLIEGRHFKVSACCGLTMLEQDDDSSRALLRADTALYRAKDKGKGAVSVFSKQMERLRSRRLHIERALRDPAARARIDLVFQPIFNTATGQLCSFEALARWQDDVLGSVAPGEFIAIAEQIGVIEEISDALFKKAVAAARAWPDHIGLSFNLSAIQLCSNSLAARILGEAALAGIQPGRVQVEVTETVLLVDFETARENLARLRSAGIQISLDDFGAGYASISYMQEMQFDCVKLDGSLLRKATTCDSSRRLLKGVIDLCASLGVPCVAEQVETRAQLALLNELQCAKVQGYLLSRPLELRSAQALAAQSVLPAVFAPGRASGQLRIVG